MTVTKLLQERHATYKKLLEREQAKGPHDYDPKKRADYRSRLYELETMMQMVDEISTERGFEV